MRPEGQLQEPVTCVVPQGTVLRGSRLGLVCSCLRLERTSDFCHLHSDSQIVEPALIVRAQNAFLKEGVRAAPPPKFQNEKAQKGNGK